MQAGGTGVFAGILANPKVYSNLGTVAGGTLAASLTLPNGVIAEFVEETAGLIVQLPAAFAVPAEGAGECYCPRCLAELIEARRKVPREARG